MSKKKKAVLPKGIRSFEVLHSNPYLIEDPITRESDGDKIFKRWTTTGSLGVTEIKICEFISSAAELAERYYDQVKKFFELSENGKKVMIHLDAICNYPTFTATINFEHAKSETGYSASQSIFNGLSELLEKKLISRMSEKNSYYLNPLVFSEEKIFTITNHLIPKPK